MQEEIGNSASIPVYLLNAGNPKSNGAVMNYDFSLNKKSLIFIISGCLAVSVLVFFAGFVLGWDRGTKHPAQLELKKQNAPVAVQNQPAAARLGSRLPNRVAHGHEHLPPLVYVVSH